MISSVADVALNNLYSSYWALSNSCLVSFDLADQTLYGFYHSYIIPKERGHRNSPVAPIIIGIYFNSVPVTITEVLALRVVTNRPIFCEVPSK